MAEGNESRRALLVFPEEWHAQRGYHQIGGSCFTPAGREGLRFALSG